MKKIRKFIVALIALSGLFVLFAPRVFPGDFQLQEVLNVATDKDVIIIFNPGGWGDTPLEEAADFAPVIKGIGSILEQWGYSSVVVPYIRAKDDFLGRLTGAKEFLSSFQYSSEDLADKIEFLVKKLPGKKIIMAGLSNGASFVSETHKKISEEVKDSVYTIAAGTPFWAEGGELGNILQLDNEGEDSLAKGDIGSLLLSLVKTPFKWILAKVDNENLSFSLAFQTTSHQYPWSSSQVNSQIVSFLKDKFH